MKNNRKVDDDNRKYICEYIWIDGQKPTSKMRSKKKVVDLPDRVKIQLENFPVWGFDGSSTKQATGDNSDCVLKPVYFCEGFECNEVFVLCEVLNTDMTPHVSNTRAKLVEIAEKYKDHEMWFGMEQEYTFFDGIKPLGWPDNGFPAPQGGYYCGVGADEVFGREIVHRHLDACLQSGIEISGVNAEVMPAQWEFQVGPLGPVEVSDQLWMARYMLYRIAESYGVSVRLDPKPVAGDWNGAGCHTNFSTKNMRMKWKLDKSETEDQIKFTKTGIDYITDACKTLSYYTKKAISLYGYGIEKRLTGKHETCSYKEFKYGVSDRGASLRIPWQVKKDGYGYVEDRRPNANCDPYVVTEFLTRIVCDHE